MANENNNQALALRKVLDEYKIPDPKIVGKLPRGGIQLDFVGHADITRILIEIDPNWRMVPCGWENGRPSVHIVNGMATSWWELTILDQARLCVGTAKDNSPDLDKVLYGDALRNGAMRFGIALSLWTKQEWEDVSHNAASKSAPVKPKTEAPSPDEPLKKTQITQFAQACAKAKIEAHDVAVHAGVELQKATVGDLDKLRASFKVLVAAQKTSDEEGE